MTVAAPFVFQPATTVERVLAAAQGLPGYFGRSARRKLMRRCGPRSVVAFDAVCAGLSAADVVLDLGANVGAFTVRHRQVPPRGRNTDIALHQFVLAMRNMQ